jgi:hypothetical protein
MNPSRSRVRVAPAKAGLLISWNPDPGVARCALTPGYFISRFQREDPLQQVVLTKPRPP